MAGRVKTIACLRRLVILARENPPIPRLGRVVHLSSLQRSRSYLRNNKYQSLLGSPSKQTEEALGCAYKPFGRAFPFPVYRPGFLLRFGENRSSIKHTPLYRSKGKALGGCGGKISQKYFLQIPNCTTVQLASMPVGFSASLVQSDLNASLNPVGFQYKLARFVGNNIQLSRYCGLISLST